MKWYRNGIIYILKPKFTDNHWIMKYWTDCLFTYEAKEIIYLYLSSQTQFETYK